MQQYSVQNEHTVVPCCEPLSALISEYIEKSAGKQYIEYILAVVDGLNLILCRRVKFLLCTCSLVFILFSSWIEMCLYTYNLFFRLYHITFPVGDGGWFIGENV